MTVNLTGAILANILFEHGNSVCDKEGLLLGKVTQITRDIISDSSLNNVEHQTVYYVHSILPCDKLFSWYDNQGEVEISKLTEILKKYDIKDVIGWYKLRKNSSMRASQREHAVHRHLEECLKKEFKDGRLIFFLCVSQATDYGAVSCFDHQFMLQNGRQFVNLPVTVMNLGDIAKPEYRTTSNFSCSSQSSYNSLVSKLSSSFINTTHTRDLKSVEMVEQIKSHLHERLQTLCRGLIDSEAELAKELAELESMKIQIQSLEVSLPSSKRSKFEKQNGIDLKHERDCDMHYSNEDVHHIEIAADSKDSCTDGLLINLADDDDDTEMDTSTSTRHQMNTTFLDAFPISNVDKLLSVEDDETRDDSDDVNCLDENDADLLLDCESIEDNNRPNEKPFEFLDGIAQNDGGYMLRNKPTVAMGMLRNRGNADGNDVVRGRSEKKSLQMSPAGVPTRQKIYVRKTVND